MAAMSMSHIRSKTRLVIFVRLVSSFLTSSKGLLSSLYILKFQHVTFPPFISLETSAVAGFKAIPKRFFNEVKSGIGFHYLFALGF